VTLARELHDAHRAANALARDNANRMALSHPFVFYTANTLGFAGVRTMFAQASDEDPMIRLLGKACRLSFDNAAPDEAFETLAAEFEGDELWPALARHLARASTPEDRSLLETLAAEPERREGVLGLGLKYWVRGDVMLPDGSERTLEQLGQPLPLLEDVPREVDIDEVL
jgi:hypothetical protein